MAKIFDRAFFPSELLCPYTKICSKLGRQFFVDNFWLKHMTENSLDQNNLWAI